MLKILPYVIICLVVVLGSRMFSVLVDDQNVEKDDNLAQAAVEKEDDAPSQKASKETSLLSGVDSNKKKSTKVGTRQGISAKDLTDMPNMQCLSSSKTEFSPTEIELLTSLKGRRQALADREQELSFKESVIKITKDQVDERLEMLGSLKEELQNIIKQYNAKEDQKNARLIKIYENMKPKDAAKIFEEMQLNALLEIIDKMRETKLSSILASMQPFKAKEITVALLNKRKASRNTMN